MVKVGSFFICDRCGKEYFYENDWQCINSDNVEGWLTHNPSGVFNDCKDLCPDCVEKFRTLLNNFYGIIKEG